MNTDTGIIKCYTPDELARAIASGQKLIEVDESKMTEKQRINMAVSLHDTRSALGRELHAARSKYMPHVGAKQLAKQQRQVTT
jgi:hypothetical protein